MTNIKRFDLNPHDGECGIVEDPTGELITWDDYLTLRNNRDMHASNAVDLMRERDEARQALTSADRYIEILKNAIKDHISDGHHFGPRSAALRNALAGVAEGEQTP